MEVAAGLLVAEQIISTTIQAGVVAGIAVARDTNKLKATFSRIATVPTQDSPDSLARSYHSVNVIDGDLYIFGGQVSRTHLAGDEMHILKLSNLEGLGPQYKAVPALAKEGHDSPQIRAGHTACVIEGEIVMFGGYGKPNPVEPLDEGGRVWLFDPNSLHWHYLDAASGSYPKLHSHAAVSHNHTLIVHGGYSSGSSGPCSETWRFDLTSRVWTQLPDVNSLPASSPLIPSAPPNLTIVGNKLYLINGSSSLESRINALDLSLAATSPAWTTIHFPTNPLTPGPRPRQGAAVIPISTAMGRTYLLLALGAKTPAPNQEDTSWRQQESSTTTTSQEASREASQEDFWSEIWSLQLPAIDYTPSQLRDATRSKIGMSSGEAEWAEVEIVLPEELLTEEGSAGKLHPGPRGYFGYTAIDKDRAVLWGGMNPRGEVEGDGWIIQVKT